MSGRRKRHCKKCRDSHMPLTGKNDHRTSRGLLKHMCAFCLNVTGSQFPHAEVDCERKKRMATKKGRPDSRDQPEKHSMSRQRR